jgi:polar amino acid transport system permease protein
VGYEFDFSAIIDNLGLLLHGAGVTLGLTAVATACGIALSIGGAAASRWGAGWARRAITAYVELIRNTPFIVQLFFIFFGLPSLGLRLSALQASVLAMTVNLTAYCIEIVRAGIEAVPGRTARGQPRARSRPRFHFFQDRSSTGLGQRLSGPGQPDHHHDAGIRRRLADCRHRSNACRRFHPVAHLSAFETYFAITLIYLLMAISLRWMFDRAGRRLFVGRR